MSLRKKKGSLIWLAALPATFAIGVGAVGWKLVQAKSDSDCCSSTKFDVDSVKDWAVFDKAYARFSKAGPNTQRAALTACFDEGTPDEVMQAFLKAMENAEDGAWPAQDGIGPQYQNGTRWTGTQGDPKVIRWSFVPDGLSISSGINEGVANSNLFATMDAAFGGNRALWKSKFVQAFARWSQLSGLTYQFVSSSGNDWDDGAAWGTAGGATRGDVRISMKLLDGASGVLAYNYFPQSGDMVIDSGDTGLWANSSGDYLRLRNVICHEHGHGIGINHVCPRTSTKLMEPFLATTFDGPQHDDIRSGQRHYGDPSEPNNTSAAATDLGAIALGSSVTKGPVPAPAVTNGSVLSIDANGEQDWFKFTLSAAGKITVNVTPIGLTYGDNAQNTNCTQTSTTNSLGAANLAVALIGTNGSTVLTTASGQASGVGEAISDYVVPSAGTYYVRVYETDAPTQCQLYHLQVSAAVSNNAPVLLGIGNKFVNEESLLSFSAFATDVDPGQVLTYSLVGEPAGATINSSSGAFTWTPTESQGPNVYSFDVKVTDNGTPAMSDSETITVTVNEVAKVISGTVTLSDWSGAVSGRVVTFEIRTVGTNTVLETKTAVLSGSGAYSFVLTSGLSAGTYDITAKDTHWLKKNRSSIAISPTGATSQNFTLINGDADDDNEITIVDAGIVSASFGKALGDAGYDPAADLDGDDEITIVDAGIISSNFGLSGD